MSSTERGNMRSQPERDCIFQFRDPLTGNGTPAFPVAERIQASLAV